MTRPLRCLALLNRIPYPLDDGWKVRTFRVLRAISAQLELTIIATDGHHADAFLRELSNPVRFHGVPTRSVNRPLQLLRGLTGSLPIYAVQEQSIEFKAAVEEELGRGQDLVLCELTAMFEHLRSLRIDSRVIIDTHNIDSLVFQRYSRTQPTIARRLYARATAGKMRRYETEAFSRAGAVIVCSEVERPHVLEIAKEANVWVVPNGASIPAEVPAHQAIPGRMLYFGRLDYHPNIDAIEYFLHEIYPRIRAVLPAAEFHVAGGHDDGTVARLMAGQAGTAFHGRVERLEPLLQQAALVVVPLRVGGGTRLKILEALAARRPVLSTHIGAEGLELAAGSEIVLASDVPTFAGEAVALLRDPSRAEALGARGQLAIERHYSWDAIGRSLVERLTGLVQAGRPVAESAGSAG